MEETANLNLPYIMPSQAQKHVTHNEALRMLDAVVQLSVIDRDRIEPPAEPEEGQRFIVGTAATGDWTGKDGQIAAWQDGGWSYLIPRTGWLCWIVGEAALVCRTGTAWTAIDEAVSALQNLTLLGLGMAADETNPFAAVLNKALWSARYDGEGGDGDLRYTMNKEATGKVLSLMMQSDWSGRAEIGLIGNDDLSLRVSPDGESWKEALVVDRESGAAQFPSGMVHPESGRIAPLYIPAPVAEIWRLDASRPATPRMFTIDSVSDDVVTLTTASVNQIFTTTMRDRTAVRIWNTSKVPAQSAWVDWNNSGTAFRVTDAGHVAGWVNGETIRLGDPDPTGENVLQMVAIDIGGYLLNNFGAVFPQKGVFLSFSVSSSDGSSALHVSASGATGTATGCNALSDGVRNHSSLPVPTTVPSPISNSNLIFLRETVQFGATDLTTAYARVLGVYV